MALTDKLIDIADAIRAKTGESDLLTLDEMPDAIAGISGGGTSGPKTYTISGDISKLNYNGQLDEVMADNNWVFTNITDFNGAFYQSHILDLNYTITTTGSSCSWSNGNFFWNTMARDPYIRRPKFIGPLANLSYVYQYEHKNDARFDLSDAYLVNSSSASLLYNFLYMSERSELWDFANEMPLSPNIIVSTATSRSSNAPYTGLGRESWARGIINIPVATYSADTSYIVNNGFFSTAPAMAHVTFALSNNTPITANWYGATLDLSYCGFYTANNYGSVPYNAPYPDLVVTDASSYNNLKNTTYWWSFRSSYSCYNKISAIETINSLPDTSACVNSHNSVNTIKFRGSAGDQTDGGAINTMTASDIAVATAKGWTVSFV